MHFVSNQCFQFFSHPSDLASLGTKTVFFPKPWKLKLDLYNFKTFIIAIILATQKVLHQNTQAFHVLFQGIAMIVTLSLPSSPPLSEDITSSIFGNPNWLHLGVRCRAAPWSEVGREGGMKGEREEKRKTGFIICSNLIFVLLPLKCPSLNAWLFVPYKGLTSMGALLLSVSSPPEMRQNCLIGLIYSQDWESGSMGYGSNNSVPYQ